MDMYMGGRMHKSSEHSHCLNWDWQTILDKLWDSQWQTHICMINWQVPLKNHVFLGSLEQCYLLRMTTCCACFPFESTVGKPKFSFWTMLPSSSTEKLGFRAAKTSMAELLVWRLQKRSCVLQELVDWAGKWTYLAVAEAYKCSSKLILK